MPLAPSPEQINSLLDYAEENQIDVRLNDEGRIQVHSLQKSPQWARFNKLFSKLVAQNKPAVHFALLKRGHPANLLERTGAAIAGSFERDASLLGSLMPTTGAGKMATAATIGADILQPELALPAQLAIGVGGGLLGEAAEKLPAGKTPDLLSAGETGVASAAAKPLMGGAIKGGKFAYRAFARPGELDRRMMWEVGKVVKDALASVAPNMAGTIIASPADFDIPGTNTVIRALNSGEMQQEVGDWLNKTREGVISQVKRSADQEVQRAAQQFQQSFGWNPARQKMPRGTRLTAPMKRQLQAFQTTKEYAATIPRDMHNAFDEIGGLGRAIQERPSAEGGAGGLKHSYSAWKGLNTIDQLKQKLEEAVDIADPSGQLKSTLEHANDQYAKFAGFRDFINIDNATYPNGRWLRADTLQKAVDAQTNPSVRFIQSRLKDAFQPLYDTVRRNAPRMLKGTPVVADRPLLSGGAMRLGESTRLGRIWSNLPLPRTFTHFIGDAAIPPQSAGALPKLLNPAATRALEQKGEPVLTNPNVEGE